MSGAIEYALGREAYERIDAENFSSLKHLLKSPAHYKAAKESPRESTDAMRLGRCVHLAVLEPERFAREVTVWEGGRRFGKEWEAFKSAAESAGQEILTLDEQAECRRIADAVRELSLFAGGMAEVTLTWSHKVVEGFALKCKARLDYVADCIFDLKLTRCSAPKAFCRQAYDLGIHIQAAMYQDAYAAVTGKRLPYFVVAVEREQPHVVTVFRVPESVIDAGRGEYDRLLATLALCRQRNEWPGYASEPVDLELPRWAETESLSLEAAQ